MKISWLKLSVDILDDHKIKKIRKLPGGNEILICWIAVLCMAMKSIRPGVLILSDDVILNADDLAISADVTNETAEIAIKTFQKLGMILENEQGFLEVKNFRNHQNLDALEYKRGLSYARKKRFNEKQKQRFLQSSNRNGTQSERVPHTTETETETENQIKNKRREDAEAAKTPTAAIQNPKTHTDPFTTLSPATPPGFDAHNGVLTPLESPKLPRGPDAVFNAFPAEVKAEFDFAWQAGKEHGLVPEVGKEKQSMFFAMVAILNRVQVKGYSLENMKQANEYFGRIVRLGSKEGTLPLTQSGRAGWAVNMFEASLEMAARYKREEIMPAVDWALQDFFWKKSFTSLKCIPSILHQFKHVRPIEEARK